MLDIPFINVNLTQTIVITANDWKELEKHIAGKRRKFMTPFTNLLSLRLQKEGCFKFIEELFFLLQFFKN